jgi:hypothetical protein
MRSCMRLLVSLCLAASMVYAIDEPTLSPAEQKVANIRAGAHSGPAESRLSGTEQELVQAAQARQLTATVGVGQSTSATTFASSIRLGTLSRARSRDEGMPASAPARVKERAGSYQLPLPDQGQSGFP